jgi:hypothetical protein
MSPESIDIKVKTVTPSKLVSLVEPHPITGPVIAEPAGPRQSAADVRLACPAAGWPQLDWPSSVQVVRLPPRAEWPATHPQRYYLLMDPLRLRPHSLNLLSLSWIGITDPAPGPVITCHLQAHVYECTVQVDQMVNRVTGYAIDQGNDIRCQRLLRRAGPLIIWASNRLLARL